MSSRRILRSATLLLAALAIFAAGALAVSPDWRRAALRLATPTPAPPLLPAATVAYGTNYDDYLRYLEEALWPVEQAVEGQLVGDPNGSDPLVPGRLRKYRFMWPRDVPFGGGVSGRDPVPGTLLGDLAASATARGWQEVEWLSGVHPLGRAFAFRRRGHTFAVVVLDPRVHEFFPGEGRMVSVPVFGRPQPPADARRTDHVPLVVLTDTFAHEGYSRDRSVLAPFLRAESRVRMERRASREAEIVSRERWSDICGPGGRESIQPWGVCVVSRDAVKADRAQRASEPRS